MIVRSLSVNFCWTVAFLVQPARSSRRHGRQSARARDISVIALPQRNRPGSIWDWPWYRSLYSRCCCSKHGERRPLLTARP